MDAFELTARITLQTDEYDRALKAAESRTSRFADVLKANLATDVIRAGFNGIVTAVKGATSAIGGLVKSSVQGYSDFEQMVGGVKKLYGNMGQGLADYVSEQQKLGKTAEQATADWHKLEDAQNLVLENARKAYKTSGMSMNQYMETATSFSASLINSLKGDTIAAAEQTDKAMKAISDNFNTFGGDIGMIQGAFQGFAKQNYTMLDNLKLGYGGTKTEMERLIADANEYAKSIGQASDLTIKNFSDVVTAIDLVQQKQQIAGTTAREASTTIAGSFMSLKSAWENLVTGFSDPDADMTGMINDVVETAETAFQNVIPVVEKALSGMANFVSQIAPIIAERLPGVVSEVVPAILSALSSLVQSVANALPGLLQALSDVLPSALDSIISTIDTVLPSVLDAAGRVIETLIEGLKRNSQKIVNTAMTLVKALVSSISGYLPMVLEVGGQILLQLFDGFLKALPEAIPAITKMLERVLEIIIEYAPRLIEAGAELISQLASGISKAAPRLVPAVAKAISTVIKSILKNAPKILKAVGNVIKSVVKEIGKLNGVEGIISKVALAFAAIKIPQGLLGGLSQLTGGFTNGFKGIAGVLSNFNTQMKGAEKTAGTFFSALRQGASDGFGAFQLRAYAGEKSIGSFFSSMKEGISASMHENGFGSLTEKVNNFSSGLSVAAKGLLAFGGGAVEIMGVSDAVTKLSDGTEHLGEGILELVGSIGTSAAAFTAAFGFPGGLIATAITGVIGLIKGVAEAIDKIRVERATEAIMKMNESVEGSTHTFKDYADLVSGVADKIGGSFDFMAEKFRSLEGAKSSIDSVVNSIGGIATAMQTQKELTQTQIEELGESFEGLKTQLGDYIKASYDYTIQQTMVDMAYLKSQGEWTDTLEQQYSERLTALYAARDGEIAATQEMIDNASSASTAYATAQAAYDSLVEAYESGADRSAGAASKIIEAEARKNELYAESREATGNLLSVYADVAAGENELQQALDGAATTLANTAGKLKLTDEEVEGGFETYKEMASETLQSMADTYAEMESKAEENKKAFAQKNKDDIEAQREHNRVVDEQLSEFRNIYAEQLTGIQNDIVQYAGDMAKAFSSENMPADQAQRTMYEFANEVFEGENGLSGSLKKAIDAAQIDAEPYAQGKIEEMIGNIFDSHIVAGGLSVVNITDWSSGFTGVIDQMVDGLPEYAKSKGYDVGFDIIQGEIDGANANKQAALDQAGLTGEDIIGALADGSGVASPSWKAYEIGAFVVEGLNNGIKDGAKSTEAAVAEWAENVILSISKGFKDLTKDFADIGKNLSEGIGNGIEKAKETLKTKIVKPIKDALKNIEKQYAQYKAAGQKLIQNLITGFTSKANDLVSKAKDIANKVYKALTDKNWTEVGKRISEGVQKGIESGKSGVIQAAVEMATAAYESAKKALEIASPSKKTMGLGKFLAQGLAEGISRNKDEAVQAMEQMSSELLSEAEKRLENYEKFNNLSLQQEVKYWTEIRRLLSEGTQAYLDATEKIRQAKLGLSVKDATLWSNTTDMAFDMWMYDAIHDLGDVDKNGKKNGMSKDERAALIVDTADQRIENRKKLYGMTDEEELAIMEQVLEQIPEYTQEWIDYYDRVEKKRQEIDQNAKEERKKNWEDLAESAKSAFSFDSVDLHSPFDEFLEDTTTDLAQYKGVIKKVAETDEEYGQEIINAAKKRLDNWETYNQMTNAEKKAFWEEIKKSVPEATQAMIEVDKIIMDIGDDIQKEAEDAAKSVQKLINDLNTAIEKVEADRQKKIDDLNAKYEKYYEDREKLDKDYQRNLESINQKEIDDIKNLEKAYRDSVEASKNSIMGMTGLFNRVSFDKTWNSDYLLDSLQQQVEALTDWDSQLDSLEKKLGSDNALYKELEAMGVSGLYTLKEINGMSDDELAEYNRLYAKKVEIATNRAEDQAKELRKQTDADIRETKDGAEENRKTLKAEYDKSCEDLKKAFDKSRGIIIESERQAFYETTAEYRRDYEKINSDAKAEMNKLQNQFNNDFKALAKSSQTNGETVGNAIIDGIQTALTNGSTVICAKVKEIVDAALKDAQSTIQVTPKTGGGSGVSTSAMSGWSTAKELGVSGTKVTDLGNGMTKVTRFNASSNSTKTGTVTQNITINSPTPLKPSEVARQVKNTTQQTVLKLAGAV